jgi:hypothetical protein
MDYEDAHSPWWVEMAVVAMLGLAVFVCALAGIGHLLGAW